VREVSHVIVLHPVSSAGQVRLWDVETGANVDTFNGSKAVYSVAASPCGHSSIALVGAEKALRVWDTRASVRQESVICALPVCPPPSATAELLSLFGGPKYNMSAVV
jgi:WD40 repeat protein